MDKRALRRAAFARIRALSDEDRRRASLAIVEALKTHPRWPSLRTVFSFLPLPSEPDLTALFLNFPEKKWGFSRVSATGEGLHFHEVCSVEDLREGEFGFLEPDPEQCPRIAGPDWILVPGVAFSPANFARLGRGKGYYDRFLSPFRIERSRIDHSAESMTSEVPSPRIIGVCFEAQFTPIEPEPHDVPMDALLTEDRWVDPHRPAPVEP